MQSFQPKLLHVLERDHRPDDVPRVLEFIRPRIANFSVDLIFGVPGQTRDQWHSDLEQSDGVFRSKATRAHRRRQKHNRTSVHCELRALVLDIADQEQRITLAWESLTLTIGGLMHGTTQADLVVTQPRIAVLASAQAEQTGSAAAFTLHVQPNPQRPASEHVIDARMTLASLLAPALDGLEGSKASAEIAAALTLSQTVFADDMTWPQQLERWRQGGGRVDVTSASLTKGGFKLDGSGHVMLDDLHRVEGRINAQATGLAPILARLGVPVAALNVGNLLNGLLKLGKGQPSPATDPGAMPLPLKFEAGEIFFGPLKMPVTLRPLY